MLHPKVKSFFDEATHTVSHVVSDPETKICAVIDSVLDYDGASGRTDTRSADRLIDYIGEAGLTLDWIIDTHIHADHLTAAHYIKDRIGGRTAVGACISEVQEAFGDIFNVERDFQMDGSQFDHLFTDGDPYLVGNLKAQALHTPGHTPACMTHVIGDAAFVGDTLFMPDYGSARCDFPGGDARILFRSVQKIFELPDETRMFLCHDYKTATRQDYVWETTIGEQKRDNIHLKAGTSESEFVKMRTARDADLPMPALIIPSVQVNIRAGEMPAPEDNGRHYLKIPLNTL